MNPPFYLIQNGGVDLELLTSKQLSIAIGFAEGEEYDDLQSCIHPRPPGCGLNKTNFINF